MEQNELEQYRAFFTNNKENYLDFCIKITKKRAPSLDFEEIKYAIGLIYDSFMLDDLNKKEIKTKLKKAFDSNLDFANYVISRSFLYLIELFYKANTTKNNIFIIQKSNEILRYINDENFTKTKPTIGFAESISKGEDEFSLHENIISTFEKIKGEHVELEFLNLYKDVPIKSYGKVVDFQDDVVTFEVGLMQMLAIIEEKNAYIVENSYTSKNVKADIKEYDIINRTIKLNNFIRFSNMPANLRKFTRVHPLQTTMIKLSSKNDRIEGILYDISKGGLALLSKEKLACQSGDILKASFELSMPHSPQKMQLELELELIVPIDYKGFYRYCMKSISNQEGLKFIENFSKQREIDTIEDLKTKIEAYT